MATKKTDTDTTDTTDEHGDLGMAEVQEKIDAENAQGFRGEKADPTPNENYTVAGVTSGKPTPETDGNGK